jgi:O-antigen/teichoic acid export membrane protein
LPSVPAELARGATAGVLIFGVGVVARTLSELIFARAMGPASFGAYSYIFAWLSILAVAGTLGVPYAFVRFIPEYEAAGNRAGQRHLAHFGRLASLGFGLAVAVLGTAVLLALRPSGVDVESVILGMASVPVLALFTVQSEVARGFRRVVLAYLPMLVMRPLITIAFALVVLAGAGQLTAAQALAAGLLAMLVCLGVQRARVRTLLGPDNAEGEATTVPAGQLSAHRDRRSAWLRVALPLLVINLLAVIAMRADVIIVGILRGSEAAGVYSVAARVALLSTFALEALNTIVAPTISRHFYAGDLEAVQRLVRGAARVTFGAALLATLLLELAGSGSLALFGSGYAEGMAALQVLLIGQLVSASTGPVTYLMVATGQQNLAAAAQAVSTALFLILAIPLTASAGFLGTAIAVTVARSTINVWMAIAAQRRLRIRSFVI